MNEEAMSPICRGKNLTLETILSFVNAMPLISMPKKAFHAYAEKRLEGWTQTHSQIARQLAFYYEKDGVCYPRFRKKVAETKLLSYMQNWAMHYYIPNIYTPSLKDKTVTNIYAFLKNQIASGVIDFDAACHNIYDDDLNNTDKIRVYISNFTDIVIDKNKKMSINSNLKVPPIQDVHPKINSHENEEAYFKYYEIEPTLNGTPMQKIFFGAPGTGKSRTLNDLAKKTFDSDENQSHLDNDDKIKVQIQKAGNDLSARLAIGLKYESRLKGLTVKSVMEKYSCDNRAAYRVCQGAKISDISKNIKDCPDEELTAELIREELTKLSTDKQASYAAIGYKYSQFFNDMTYGDVEKALNLQGDTTSTVQWINAAAKIKDLLNEESIAKDESHIERVTFHPNYSYAQFVGTYKPVQDSKDKTQIRYDYVPGPFMRTYVKAQRAKQNKTDEKYLLVIEEINRANVAAVFGDVFQLLDRKKGESEYPIAASEDVKKYLKNDCGIDHCEELKIPDNMYIWATMNSADQGVLPMDTAFKRRWEFGFIDINHNESEIDFFYLPTSIDEKNNVCIFENWNSLRKILNEKLQSIGVNEDKLLGPFFINKDALEEISHMINPQMNADGKYNPVEFPITADDVGDQNRKKIEAFQKSFESKVLMYLYDDMRMYRSDIFQIKDDDGKYIDKPRLSQIFKAFERDGIKIFNFSTDRS